MKKLHGLFLLLAVSALVPACSGAEETTEETTEAVGQPTGPTQPTTATVSMNVKKPCLYDGNGGGTLREDDWDAANTPGSPLWMDIYDGVAQNGVSEGLYFTPGYSHLEWYDLSSLSNQIARACADTNDTPLQVTLTIKYGQANVKGNLKPLVAVNGQYVTVGTTIATHQ